MTLSLTMLRCPGSVPPQSRTVEAGDFAIGRGPENDWVLPDPERYLSKRHCMLSCSDGGWTITDYSTNGTFINHDRSPLGRGHVRELNDGDRLHMGTYEIEIRVLEHGQPKRKPAQPAPAIAIEPLADIIAPQPGLDSLLQTRTAVEPLVATRPKPAFRLPEDYDPLAPDPDIDTGLSGPVRRVALPEDWDTDLDPAEPATVSPRLAAPGAPAAGGTASSDALIAAFLKGVRINHAPPADPASAMQALGALFREMIFGLRQAIIARSKLKGKYRIEQTSIRTHGNNPLKFSAKDEDALSSIIASVWQGDSATIAAVSDALNDIRLHELATVSALQTAAAELLAELDPVKLRESGDTGFNLVSSQRKARAWEAFEAQYERVRKSLGDGLESAFGKAFARAYEQALSEVSGKKNA